VAANPDAFNFASNTTTNGLNKLKAPPPIGSNAAVMLVRSDTPQMAEREVTGYLDAQQIPWKQAPASAGIVGQTFDTAQNQNRSLSSANEQPELRQRAAPEEQPRQAQRSGNSEREAVALGTAVPAGKAGLPTTRPADTLAQVNQAAPNDVAVRVDNLPDNSTPANVAYVARMYRRQAIELTNSLTRDRSQTAELKDTDGNVRAGSEAASPAANQANGGFGGGGGFGAGRAGGVDEATRMATKLEAQTPVTQPSLGVLRGAATTQPATPAANAQFAQSQEALKDSQPPAPTTQPQGPQPPATMPSDDQPIDVVILVKANSTAPAAAPATQPAGASNSSLPAPATQPAR